MKRRPEPRRIAVVELGIHDKKGGFETKNFFVIFTGKPNKATIVRKAIEEQSNNSSGGRIRKWEINESKVTGVFPKREVIDLTQRPKRKKRSKTKT